MNRLLLLKLIESAKLFLVVLWLRWAHFELMQAVHIEARVAVVEALSNDDLTFIDRVLPHLGQV